MSLRRAVQITIGCDQRAPTPCTTTFTPTSEKTGEAQTEARDAGWYIGVGGAAFCPSDATKLGLRVKKPSSA